MWLLCAASNRSRRSSVRVTVEYPTGIPVGEPQRAPTSGVVSPTFTDTYLRVRPAASKPRGSVLVNAGPCAASAQ